ncbi:ATP4, subunit B of the stator stalk of mitochondrial F1F0 ATP synthase [Exidia glandulosa HHB12029]|uniref:ATP synthase subunit 4 n=1 Tax=Exidia glandulosa HHB12029 TaxID=1314781 RepID=A0A165CB36_EXIGL|nr:ATP4, subunit B of the stator stalk of mitochondrial F1F0 ATP synthase [Exidia glandulosa HHB12029]
MTSRIAASSLRAAGEQTPRAATAAFSTSSRAAADKPSPAERASQIIESAPSSGSLVTKTGSIVLGTGLVAAAISQEIYVVNGETVIAAGFFIIVALVAKLMRTPYVEWANGHIERIKGILEDARAQHTQAVKSRIDSVQQMKDVVDVTKGLFALSKETAQLESDVFVQRQRVALAAELKQVLDSWVRYEQQQKESEQAELAKTVISKVMASLQDEKTKREILLGAVAEVEQLVKNKAI